LRILYCFTSSYIEPFASLQKTGADATWRLTLPPEDKSLAIYANGSGKFKLLYKASLIFEKLRWGKFGKYSTLILRYFIKPFGSNIPSWREKDGDLIVDIPEGLTFLGFKMLASMNYASQNQFDWLVLTNLSSYPVCSEIRECLAGLEPNVDLYAGKRLPSDVNRGISGSFVILSAATIKKILMNKHSWDHSALDDIALMKLTKQLNIDPTYLPSITLTQVASLEEVVHQIKKGTLHYKCGPFLENYVRQDYILMRILFKLLNG
jgi:hypothetical protein